MSKNICDVCGSTFPENATECPVCGTSRSGEAKPLTQQAEKPANNGGKFSKLRENMAARNKKSTNGKDDSNNNLPMIVIVTVLLLAIVSVCVFIAIRFMDKPGTPDDSSVPSSSTETTPTEPTVLKVPCTGIELVNNDTKTLSFAAVTESAKLTMKALPENTTDNVTYSFVSSDPAVVLVDQTGFVTPVATGKATITVSYGTFSVTVDVDVNLPVVLEEVKLLFADVTLSPNNGLKLNLYNGEVPAEDITWTSSDESIVVVENGVVTAVGNGKATVTATYGEAKAGTCIVRVSGVTSGATNGNYVLTYTDVTLQVGETITLKMKDKNTNEVVKNVKWTFSPQGAGYCNKANTTDGVKITATKDTSSASGGYVYVQGEYNGEVIRCIIRIKPAAAQG